MAKVNVVGDAMVVTSTLKLEDIKRVESTRPEALILCTDDEKKEQVFKVGTADKPEFAGITKYGVTFAKASRDGGLAQITVCTIDAPADVKEWVADTFGASLMYLNTLEEFLPKVIADINEKRQAIIDSVELS